MTEKQNGNGYSKAAFYISALVTLFAFLGGVVGAIFWISNIAQAVNSNAGLIADLDRRLEIVSNDLRANDLATSNIQRDLREVETQFCASDIVRNLMHANDMRTVSLLWERVYRARFPTDNSFYPQVCNRNIQDR